MYKTISKNINGIASGDLNLYFSPPKRKKRRIRNAFCMSDPAKVERVRRLKKNVILAALAERGYKSG